VAGSDSLPSDLAIALSRHRSGLFDPSVAEQATDLCVALDDLPPERAAVRLAALRILAAKNLSSQPKPTLAKEKAMSDPLRNKKATIGIITALPKECAAVRLMLENLTHWTASGEGGGRRYFIGEIPASGGGVHTVAVALLLDTGNNSAAIRATQLLCHFPNVQHLIMCGIAGGVPKPGKPEHDVRLGDIVVSNRNGVVQYDFGKEELGGAKEHRYPPRPPGPELLEAVQHIQTEETLRIRPWEAFLVRANQMEDATRPADNIDARGEPINYPQDPKRKEGLPRVFHATIAAANNLLKNPAHRDYLGEKFGVKAVEMEGSGVADAAWVDRAGYLVVRGVCDYCDENKGDAWQGTAAISAASYVRALIESMPPETTYREKSPGEHNGNTSNNPPRVLTQLSLSEQDYISILEEYLRGKSYGDFLIKYSEVDSELQFPPGTTQKILPQSCAGSQCSVKQQNPNTATVRRENPMNHVWFSTGGRRRTSKSDLDKL
jgi:nucleoside phosphorylase